LFVINNGSTASDAALRVLLIVMCAVMFKRWVEDEARAQANLASSSAARPSPAKSD
jgi:hypothetical protein